MRIRGRVRERFALPPLVAFALAPFLFSACILLMLVTLYGLLRLLSFIGLNSLALPIGGIGMIVVLPFAFLMAVRIGQLLLGTSIREHNL